MDPVVWQHLGARLSSRALRILVSGEGPAALDVRAADAYAQAAREAASLGPFRPCGKLVTAADPDYPERFWRLEKPPAALWFLSAAEAAREPPRRVAVIGARRATRSGRALARLVAGSLAARGVEVWSGLARGIDAAAHEGALQAGGRTAAVLGTGLDRIYPFEHRALARRIQASGELWTEFPPGTPPLPYHFPQRNRLIAAAVDLLIVIEAGEKSGALTTVNWALSLGVQVLVAPGDPLSESSRGSNRLIQAGAGILLEPADAEAALGLGGGPSERCGSGDARAKRADHPLLAALSVEPLHVDELAERWEGPGPAAAELVRLEMEGAVEALPGGLYALAAPARGRG